MNAEVVVVGGGLGGLSAAACLAGQGHSVVLVEAAEALGGKAGVVTLDGVEVDTGPSLITLTELIDSAFRMAGTRLADEVVLVEPDGGFDCRFPDARVVLGHGLEGTLRGIEAGLGPKAADQAERFLHRTRVIWEEVAPAFVMADAPRALSLFALGPWKWLRLFRADPFRTMWDAIRAQIDDPRLRAIFARFATYNGSDPRRAPATLNCIAWVELGLGAYGIQGGVYELVRAFERVARRQGVAIRTGTPVREIERDGDGIRAVTLADGTRIATRNVVCNTDVRHLVRDLLPGALQPRGELSTSGWTAILKAPRAERCAHGVVFPERYLAEFEDLFDHRQPPREPTVYVCSAEKAHRRAGWASHEALFAMVNAPAGGGPVDGVRQRALERLFASGLVEADAEVLWERTPRQLAERFPGSEGALYGAASNSRFAAFQRPANAVPAVPGLFLASGTAHPGGGVPMVIQSGRMAATHAITRLRRGGA